MTAPATVSVYWSMQSAYCYFALDRLLALEARADVAVDLRPARPGVLRQAGRYVEREAIERRYFDLDVRRTADFLGLPFAEPNPSPVEFKPETWQAAEHQPRIGWLYDLLLAATARGRGLAFLDKVMRLIWDGRTQGWDTGDHMEQALAAADLDLGALKAEAETNREALMADLHRNEADMLASGHWGVPLCIYRGEPFYGQDRLDQRLWRLEAAT
ncbi:MAG: DsbA family protein [Pseudomonadota bacterium]